MTYGAVLLLVGDLNGATRELSSLADGGKGSAETHGDQGSKEETTGIQTDDDIDLFVNSGVDMIDNVGDDHLNSDGILEQGEDILEQDAGLWEVGDFADEGVDAFKIHG